MRDKDLSQKPHKIKGTENVWWYEDSAGIELIVNYGGYNTGTHLISWRAIRNALKRKDKK